MNDEAFVPGTPEADVEVRRGEPLLLEGQRGKLGTMVLTNDRILWTHQKFASTAGGGVLAELVAQQLQKRSERKAGGPMEVCQLAEVTSATPVKRRFLPDLYELGLSDGSSFRISVGLRKAWDPIIRRLLTDRHGRTISDGGDGSWRAE